MHPSLAEILAVASGAGSAEARRHYDSCKQCRSFAEVTELPKAEDSDGECRRLAPLLDALSAGRIERSSSPDLQRHLLECRECRCLVTERAAGHLPLQVVPARAYDKLDPEAQGGMGNLFRATDRRLGRQVMIKEQRDPSLRNRFEQEARITARLQHPAVVGVIEAGVWDEDGQPFYAMEYVNGETLAQRIARCRKLEDRLELLPAVITVAEALAYAHDKQIVHRDVKPENVMVGDFGESVLIDWGIAKDLTAPEEENGRGADSNDGGASTDNSTRHGLGTAPYMPPEQAAGDRASPRMDVYALGATLYHLFAGRPPYRGNDVRAQLEAGPPPPLDAVAPRDTPREIKSIIAKAMARDPAERFANAKLLANELVRFRNGRLVRSHRYSYLDRSRHWWRQYRNRIRGRVAFMVSAALGVFALGSLGRIVYERDRAERTAAALLVDQARQEFLQGSSMRALAYLREARRQGAGDVTLRYLTAAAKRDVEALERIVDGQIVEISADGTRILGNRDGVATEWPWDEHSPVPARSFAGRALAYGGGGARIVTVDGTQLRVIEAATGRLAHTLAVDGEVTFAADVGDGRMLVVEKSGTLRVWSADGTLAGSSRVLPRTYPRAQSLSRDRRRLVLTEFGGDQLEVVDTATGRVLNRWSAKGAHFIADISPDGSLAVAGGADGTATVWETATGSERHVLRGHTGIVTQVAFTPDGSRVITLSDTAECRIWDPATGTALASFDTGDRFADVEVSPDGRQLATSLHGGVKLWSIATGARLASFESAEGEEWPGGAVRFDARGDHVFRAGDRRSSVWSTRRGRQRFEHETDPASSLWAPLPSPDHVAIQRGDAREYFDIRSGVLSPAFPGVKDLWLPLADGTLLTLDGSGTLSRIESSGSVRWTRALGAHVDEGSVSPDGRWIVLRGGQTIWIASVETGIVRQSVTVPAIARNPLLWGTCPDGSCVIAGVEGSVVRMYEQGGATRVLDGLIAQRMPGSTAFNARITDDGRYVVAYVTTTAPAIAEIRRYDRKTGDAIGTAIPTSAVSFDAHGDHFVTVDGFTVEVRRIRSGEITRAVRVPDGAIDVGLSRPNASLLVTSGFDGVARIWRWRTGKLVEELGGRTPRVFYDRTTFSCCEDFTMLLLEGGENEARLWTRNERTTAVWDIHLDSADEIESFLKEHEVPWRVRQGGLERADE